MSCCFHVCSCIQILLFHGFLTTFYHALADFLRYIPGLAVPFLPGTGYIGYMYCFEIDYSLDTAVDTVEDVVEIVGIVVVGTVEGIAGIVVVGIVETVVVGTAETVEDIVGIVVVGTVEGIVGIVADIVFLYSVGRRYFHYFLGRYYSFVWVDNLLADSYLK